MSELSAIILAAGKGKRMNSDLPKVLHLVGGRPMVAFSFLAARALNCKKMVFVVPQDDTLIKEAVVSYSAPRQKLHFAVQNPPRGTGDAVRVAIEAAGLGKSETVIVLNGDMPLVEASSIAKLLALHKRSRAVMTILSANKDDPSGFGRVKRNTNGSVVGIVEDKDASDAERKICEANVGVYAFNGAFLKEAVYQLKTANEQKEYYLPDLVMIALKAGHRVEAFQLQDQGEALGANSRAELAKVNGAFYRRQREHFSASGVTLVGEEVFVDAGSTIERDCVLESPCYVKGESVIKSGVTIETGCVIKSSQIAEGSHLKAYCYIDDVVIEKNAHVGPFAHLRPGTHLKDGVKIGNFVETKKSVFGKNSKANHLSYIGDATLGEGVNIGAGTITCNYDGVNKFKTIIEDGVFIGSDTQLVAPVKLGKGSFVGAGTTVTKDVPPFSLVTSRVPQTEFLGWAKKRKKTPKSK